MAYCFGRYYIISLSLALLASLSIAQSSYFKLPLKAVSLGNWLVTEGWMQNLSLYDGMPNKDLLDGTQIQLKSTKLGKYLCAEHGGGDVVVGDRSSASGWESFTLWRINQSTFNLRVFKKQFVGLQNSDVVARYNQSANPETFQIVRKNNDPNRVRLKASNGLFVQVRSEREVTADYSGSGWDDSDPSVFIMTVLDNAPHGEYQLTNGYGPARASKVLQKHWKSYITEKDFGFMSSNGLSAVRIPVGWWIASDPTPPKPFVGGSLRALDNAFTWSQKYGMKVIIDLHAAQGSQNGNDHSATRDGSQEWGDPYISATVAVIDFLANRYANNPSLIAIELINEPLAPGVDLDTLKRYYQAGYDAVRKYTQNAYVILSNRLGPADPKELLSFARSLNRVVIDVHYYSLYSDSFNDLTVNQNLEFIYNQRASDLNTVTTSNGPLTFVGEWSAEWKVSDASNEDYRRFAQAQLDVYRRATFGWAYWTYKCQYNHWSLKWMMENNFIKLN